MKNIILIILIVMAFYGISNAQCYPDRHNTSWYNGWVSCETAPNPNPVRGDSHWIFYDFGAVYTLGQMHVWNYNDPGRLDFGAEEVVIDYSEDGTNWLELGTYNFEQASGESIYEGFESADFNGINAQYVIITVLNTFGSECAGIAEIKIGTEGTIVIDNPFVESENKCLDVDIFPNPFVSESNLRIISHCSKPVFYSIKDIYGREVLSEREYSGVAGKLNLGNQIFASGIYFVVIRQGDVLAEYRLVKLDR